MVSNMDELRMAFGPDNVKVFDHIETLKKQDFEFTGVKYYRSSYSSVVFTIKFSLSQKETFFLLDLTFGYYHGRLFSGDQTLDFLRQKLEKEFKAV